MKLEQFIEVRNNSHSDWKVVLKDPLSFPMDVDYIRLLLHNKPKGCFFLTLKELNESELIAAGNPTLTKISKIMSSVQDWRQWNENHTEEDIRFSFGWRD